MDQTAHVQPRMAELDLAIVRACTKCRHLREAGLPCAGCGNPEPPVVHQLGRQSASYRHPVRAAWWKHVGAPLAARRARKANAAARRISEQRDRRDT